MPTAPSRKHIVVGQFSPTAAQRDRAASQLAHHLHAAGSDVILASEPDYIITNIELVYRSTRLFVQTLQTVEKTAVGAKAYVFASGLMTANIDKPRMRNRLKEIWRRGVLSFSLGRHATRVIYVLDRPLTSMPFWLALLAGIANSTRAPFRTRIAGGKRFSRQIGLENISQTEAADTVFEITDAGKHHLIGTVSPRSLPSLINRLKREKNIDEELAVTLRDIRQLAAETWRNGPHFLRNFRSIEGDGISRQRQLSAKFPQHYRAVLKINPTISDDITQTDAKFQNWYLNSNFTQKAFPYLPIDPNLVLPSASLNEAAVALLKFAPRVTDLPFLSSDQINWFSAPVSSDPAALSHAEVFFAQCAELVIGPREFHTNLWRSDEIRNWFYTQLCRAAPALLPFSTYQTEAPSIAPSANISGIVKGESGLSQNARMSARTLNQLNIPVTLRDYSTLYQITERSHVAAPRQMNRTLHLHNINADRIPQQVLSTSLTSDNAPLHVGYLLWELNTIPTSHQLAGEMLDDIWAPSEFVRRIYETAYGREVVNIGKALYLPEFPSTEPRQYYLFLTSFDNNSSVERKNPLATVHAFSAAFPNDPDVRLLVKATHPSANDWGDPHGQMDKINRMAAKDKRITVDQRHMPYHTYLELFAQADCIVSSHRAEGFGYVPAYGLFYEKPVIVTDYSGTQDFCNSDTAFLVRHRLKPVRPNEVIAMADGAEWADIDVDDLAAQMQYVRNNPTEAANRACAGRALLQQKYSPEAHAERYRQRLVHLGVIEN